MKPIKQPMPLHVRDYLGDTGHLTLEQSGAYLHLLMQSWIVGPLPNDDAKLARICRVSVGRWMRNFRVEVMAFFDLSEGGWTQKRLEKLRHAELKNSTTASEKAKAKWLKYANSADAAAYAGHMLDDSPHARHAGAEYVPEVRKEERKEDKQASKKGKEVSNQAIFEKTQTSEAPKRGAQAALALDLPSWLPEQSWLDFIESRRKMRHPMTDRAKALLIRRLDDFRRRGIDVEAALNEAVIRGWRDVYEPKPAHGGSVLPFRKSATQIRSETMMWAAGDLPDDGLTIDQENPREAWR